MLIIELYGTNGCGKTTLAEEVIERLKGHDLKVAGYSDIEGHKLNFLLTIKEYKSYPITFSILFYLINYPFSKTSFKFYKCLLNLCYRLKKLKHANHYDVILLEEGFCQYLASIAYDKNVKDNYFLRRAAKAIKKVFPDLYLIDCKISLDENLSRVRSRGRTGSRYDSVTNDNKLLDLLKIQKKNLGIIGKNISPPELTLDLENDPQYNQDKIIDLIISRIN
ncbi:MAG: hypothetical protein FWE14_07360 [Lachnospiraceae bacterium]|nr:hypothetical protein [Lachnospiraceae bacterium]